MGAGVASLLLSRDNLLTARNVYDIMRYSAVTDVGPGPGPISPPDLEYGYGRVDAFRAILSIARGDVANDGFVDLSDITRLIDYLFVSFIEPFPDKLLGDCDCSGIVDIGDLAHLIGYLFFQPPGPPPVTPCYNFGD
jgi:hypothetical protein